MTIHIEEHFDQSQDEVWAAVVDAGELSAWLGGTATIEPRVGGQVRFDLSGDLSATGVVRACTPPSPELTVAHLEHTFVDADRPDVTSVCVWSIVRRDDGCDLHFTMDDGETSDPGPFADVWSALGDGSATATGVDADGALAAFESAQSVLLVDWVLDEIPATIAAAAPLVYGKVGPGPEDWAVIEPTSGDPGYRAVRGPRPEHVDLLHLDWTLGFEDFVGVAKELGAKTFWYHSARTRPPAPADRHGCWVPPRQSAAQRLVVEQAGMTYIDSHSIVEVARRSGQ